MMTRNTYFPTLQGCARFDEIWSELTKSWSSGATEFRVWIRNYNVKMWKSTEDKLHNIWNSKYFCQISAKTSTPKVACHQHHVIKILWHFDVIFEMLNFYQSLPCSKKSTYHESAKVLSPNPPGTPNQWINWI